MLEVGNSYADLHLKKTIYGNFPLMAALLAVEICYASTSHIFEAILNQVAEANSNPNSQLEP